MPSRRPPSNRSNTEPTALPLEPDSQPDPDTVPFPGLAADEPVAPAGALETSRPAPSAKKPTSARKIEANRRNARKSTGPKTEAGKSVSRLNALKHGMRADTIILPGEDPRKFQQRLRAWNEELGATTTVAQFLVGDAVVASWRIERCRAAETAHLSAAVRRATDVYDHAQARWVDRTVADLEEQPAVMARQIRQRAVGCRHVLDELETLREALHARDWLEPSERERLLLLMGKTSAELFRDPNVFDICEAALASGAKTGGDACTIQTILGIPDPERQVDCWELLRRLADFAKQVAEMEPAQAMASLRRLIDHEIERLSHRWLKLAERDDLERDGAVARAACDVSKDAVLRMRYEDVQRRTLHNSLRHIHQLNNQTDRLASKAPARAPRLVDALPHHASAALEAPNEAKSQATSGAVVAVAVTVVDNPFPDLTPDPLEPDGGEALDHLLLVVEPPDPAADPSPRHLIREIVAPNEANAATESAPHDEAAPAAPAPAPVPTPAPEAPVVYRGQRHATVPDLRLGPPSGDAPPTGPIAAVRDFESFCRFLDQSGLDVPDPVLKIYPGMTPPTRHGPPPH